MQVVERKRQESSAKAGLFIFNKKRGKPDAQYLRLRRGFWGTVGKADYVMKNIREEKNVFLFLAESGEKGKYFCRSFFPQNKMDYTKNQALWTLLYKKKITLSTGKEEILYDRLKRK